MTVEEAFQLYEKEFGETFPTMLVMGADDDYIVEQIELSIASGKPYEGEGLVY